MKFSQVLTWVNRLTWFPPIQIQRWEGLHTPHAHEETVWFAAASVVATSTRRAGLRVQEMKKKGDSHNTTSTREFAMTFGSCICDETKWPWGKMSKCNVEGIEGVPQPSSFRSRSLPLPSPPFSIL